MSMKNGADFMAYFLIGYLSVLTQFQLDPNSKNFMIFFLYRDPLYNFKKNIVWKDWKLSKLMNDAINCSGYIMDIFFNLFLSNVSSYEKHCNQ